MPASSLRRPGRRLLAGALLVLTSVAPAVWSDNAVAEPGRAAAATPVIESIGGAPGAGPAGELTITPSEMTVRNGILYFVDTGGVSVPDATPGWPKSVIRAIDLTTRRSWVVAGGGDDGLDDVGDGRLATAVALIGVTGVAVDADGSVFIGEGERRRVRKVRPDGIIVTVAGNGAPTGGPDLGRLPGRATDLPLSRVEAIALDDAGRLLIGLETSIVLRVDRDGRMTHVAGVGGGAATRDVVATKSALYGISGLAADGHGGFLIVEEWGNAVSRVDSQGRITGFCCDYMQESPIGPQAVTLDDQGRGYIADWTGNRILRRELDGTVRVVAGKRNEGGFSGDGGPATESRLLAPTGVAWAGGSLYVADTDNHRIRVIGPDGRISTLAGNDFSRNGREGVELADAQFWNPEDVAIDATGSMFLTDDHYLYRADQGVLHVLAGRRYITADPGYPDDICCPRGVTADGAGGAYFTADVRVHHVDRDGDIRLVAGGKEAGYSGDGGPATQARLGSGLVEWGPADLVLDYRNRLFVADTGNQVIRMIDEHGMISTVAGTGMRGRGPNRSDRATQVSLNMPTNLTVDSGGRVYFSDTGNGLVRRLDPSGGIVTVAGGGSRVCPPNPIPAGALGLTAPRGVAFRADGVLFVADAGFESNCVVRIGPDGQAVALTGQAYPALAGDGANPERAFLKLPAGIFLQGDDLYIADKANRRFRRMDVDFDPSPAYLPCPPRAVRVTAASERYALVHWESPETDGGRPIRGYNVVDDRNSGGGSGDVGHWVLVYVPDRRPYVFTVTAVTNAGESAPVSSAPFIPGQTVETPPSSGVCHAEMPPPVGVPTGDSLSPLTPSGSPPPPSAGPTAGTAGYWMLTAEGSVHGFGRAAALGDVQGRMAGGRSAVDLEPTATGGGYWIVDVGGVVSGFGDARSFGGAPVLRPGEKVTSLSATPSSQGYRLFTSLGRVFPYGDATSFGDLAEVRLNGPVLDSITTPDGGGYYMVASDGGVFAFGSARFMGSMGGTRLNKPVQSLVPDPDGSGYWLVASDGGVFAFDAPFRGSTGSVRLNRPVSGMIPYGNGYLMVAEDGGIFTFSDAPFLGSLGAAPPPSPVVSVAARPAA